MKPKLKKMLTFRLKSLAAGNSRCIFLGCGEFPPEVCALEGSGELDSGEDMHLISSSCEGIVTVRDRVGFFLISPVYLLPISFAKCID